MSLSAGAYTGYTFKNYTCSDAAVVFNDSTDPNATFTMPAKDIIIQANWELTPFTITMADPDCNSVEGGPEFHYGDVVSISCTSPEFVEWSCDDPTVVFADKTSSTTTFTMGTKSITINHSFKSYTVTFDPPSPFSPTGAGSYRKGDTVTVSANDTNPNYEFTIWSSSPTVTFADPTSPITTFIMPGSDVKVALIARSLPMSTVTVIGSTAINSGDGTYVAGSTVTVTTGTKPGYRFTGWTSPDVTFADATNPTTTFTMPESTVDVTANWEQIKYSVTVTNSQTTPDGSGSYAQGDVVTLNANPTNFHHWQVVSGAITMANALAASTTFTMPAMAVEVKPIYNTEVFRTATIDGVASQHYVGEKVSIDAGTKEGYVFDKWTATPDVQFVDN